MSLARASLKHSPLGLRTDPAPIHYTTMTGQDVGIQPEFAEAYEKVLLPCFASMSVTLEPHTSFDKLSRPDSTVPGATFHLVTARDGGNMVGASCFVTYEGHALAYWIYDAVLPEYRGSGIASEMHKRMYDRCASCFEGQAFTIFAEMPITDAPDFYKRRTATGFREIKMDYLDSLGHGGWGPVIRFFGSNASECAQPEMIPKDQLMEILTLNRQLPPNTSLNDAERKDDSLLSFYRTTLEGIPGEAVPLSLPQFRHVKHARQGPGRSSSCTDLY